MVPITPSEKSKRHREKMKREGLSYIYLLCPEKDRDRIRSYAAKLTKAHLKTLPEK